MMIMRKHSRLAAATGLAATMALVGCGGATSSGLKAGDGPAYIYLTTAPIGVNKFLESGKVGTDAAAVKFQGTSKTVSYTHLDVYKRQGPGRISCTTIPICPSNPIMKTSRSIPPAAM